MCFIRNVIFDLLLSVFTVSKKYRILSRMAGWFHTSPVNRYSHLSRVSIWIVSAKVDSVMDQSHSRPNFVINPHCFLTPLIPGPRGAEGAKPKGSWFH